MSSPHDIVECMGEALHEAIALAGGWREAICELEDWCSEMVRLKNMLAARDGLDRWVGSADELLTVYRAREEEFRAEAAVARAIADWVTKVHDDGEAMAHLPPLVYCEVRRLIEARKKGPEKCV